MTRAEIVEVFVMKTGAGFRVRPAYIAAHPGQVVHVVNLTKGRIKLYFPEPQIWSAGKEIELVEAEGRAELEVAENPRLGHFPYAVFSEDAKDFCSGESSPEVIITR